MKAEARTGLLNDKVALVTGGASGIGKATARAFAAAGAGVVLVDIDRAGGEAAARELIATRRRALFLSADVSSGDDCERVVQQTVDALGGLDILVNCAGVIQRATVVETEERDWDHVLAVNLKSIYLLSRQAIPLMAAAGGGTIINVASGWGLIGGRRAAAYCASKGAVVQLTRAMALDHGGQNIRVNCICPGDTDTPLLQREAEQIGIPLQRFRDEAGQRPLPGLVQPEDVASAALFVASEAAASITGTTLVVDRGGLAGT